ncbi:MAG: hypothetical protein ACXVGE_22455 [Blastococcus sp.]
MTLTTGSDSGTAARGGSAAGLTASSGTVTGAAFISTPGSGSVVGSTASTGSVTGIASQPPVNIPTPGHLPNRFDPLPPQRKRAKGSSSGTTKSHGRTAGSQHLTGTVAAHSRSAGVLVGSPTFAVRRRPDELLLLALT